MADYYTRFSCWLDTGSTDNATRAMRRFAAYERLMERNYDIARFEVEADPMEDSPGGIWIHDGDGAGDPDHVINYVLTCAKRFKLRGRWGFSWGYDCSRPILDAFGGGACVLDLGTGEIIGDLHCGDWLDKMIQAGKRFMIYSPNEDQMAQRGGYWSSDNGWVDFDSATIFTWSARKTNGLPASLGNDADWIEIDADGNPRGENHLPVDADPAKMGTTP
ncbi:MAG: hypothetical protein PHT60_14075 [Acidiphilium sp.]|nr:hypothetical protein [Acidiphilium sp.]MDD4936893.1 hypothetical protein [Acidiphilium sp.]